MTLFTVKGRESGFVTELIKQQQLALLDMEGEPTETRLCPRCQQGTLVVRARRSDGNRFLGCSRFPQCNYTSNLPQVGAKRRPYG
ncbi:DNA topoisomerase I [compost metagenome]